MNRVARDGVETYVRSGRMICTVYKELVNRDGVRVKDCNYLNTTTSYKRDLRGTTIGTMVGVGWMWRIPEVYLVTSPYLEAHAVVSFNSDIHHATMNDRQFSEYILACLRTRRTMRRLNALPDEQKPSMDDDTWNHHAALTIERGLELAKEEEASR